MDFVMSDVPKLATQLSTIIQQTPTYRPHIELGRSFAEELVTALEKINAKDSIIDKAEQVLTPTEFRIWRMLYQLGTVVDTETLLEVSDTKTEASLWVHMRRLRNKLIMYSELGNVVTVHGKGYMCTGL
ncbi:MAG: helix-turn-helix domain-containing protein [Caldilineaceae bacterium]|nr:helix-turn-helix domain-containing protein [Caldilineaceae bacterium]